MKPSKANHTRPKAKMLSNADFTRTKLTTNKTQNNNKTKSKNKTKQNMEKSKNQVVKPGVV
jgi:hypothetical protein